MTMALAAQQAQYHLNFSNPPFGVAAAALAAHMEAANFVRAAQLSSPLATLEFTKSSMAGHLSDDRYGGLKIPQPGMSSSRTMGSSLSSSFGTSRLQVKVNSDGPTGGEDVGKSGSPPVSTSSSSAPQDSSSGGSPSHMMTNGKHVGTHSMPAILPFHGVKKVQALPKTVSQARPPTLVAGGGVRSPHHQSSPPPPSSPLTFPKSPATANSTASPLLNTIQSLTDSNPFKTSGTTILTTSSNSSSSGKGSNNTIYSAAQFTTATSFKKALTPPTSTAFSNPFKAGGGQQTQANNSLKKLAADLNTAQQKTLKGDNNILNALKKSSGGTNNSMENSGKLSDYVGGGGKGFNKGTGEVKKGGGMEAGGRKEVTTSS
jgi:hypothetical protein